MSHKILQELIERGVSAETIMAVGQLIFDAEATKIRRAADRERKQRQRNITKSADVRGCPVTSQDTPPSSPSPSSPLSHSPPNNPLPLLPPLSSLRSESIKSDFPEDFRDKFWSLYPRKVGKKAVFHKLELVRRSGEISWPAFVSAIGRIETEKPEFIPHPMTWLNQGRYLDGDRGETYRNPAVWGPQNEVIDEQNHDVGRIQSEGYGVDTTQRERLPEDRERNGATAGMGTLFQHARSTSMGLHGDDGRKERIHDGANGHTAAFRSRI